MKMSKTPLGRGLLTFLDKSTIFQTFVNQNDILQRRKGTKMGQYSSPKRTQFTNKDRNNHNVLKQYQNLFEYNNIRGI